MGGCVEVEVVVDELARGFFDPDTLVGHCCLRIHGWVVGFGGAGGFSRGVSINSFVFGSGVTISTSLSGSTSANSASERAKSSSTVGNFIGGVRLDSD